MSEEGMSQNNMPDLETELRSAFRRQDPPDGFADCVMARLPQQRPAPRWRREWLAIAASACIAVIGAAAFERHQQQVAGEKARQELIFALTVAADSLNTTRQIITR